MYTCMIPRENSSHRRANTNTIKSQKNHTSDLFSKKSETRAHSVPPDSIRIKLKQAMLSPPLFWFETTEGKKMKRFFFAFSPVHWFSTRMAWFLLCGKIIHFNLYEAHYRTDASLFDKCIHSIWTLIGEVSKWGRIKCGQKRWLDIANKLQ